MISRSVARLRAESGFGLVELIVAITVLNVGIFAALSAFSSGYVAINRTKAIASGSAIVSRTRIRGFTEPNGSWNTICT